jgi:hypothetical protein
MQCVLVHGAGDDGIHLSGEGEADGGLDTFSGELAG